MAGAAPSFGEVHLTRTLLALSRGRVGRKSLVGILGVGEGSVRTIIKKLTLDGLVVSKPRGHELSVKGRRLVSRHLRQFTLPEMAELDVAPGKKCCVVVARGLSEMVTSGLREREIAVKSGADGAVLLKNKGNSLEFPCGDVYLEAYPGTKVFLDRLGLSRADVVIIAFSDSPQKAVDGALSIALDLYRRVQ